MDFDAIIKDAKEHIRSLKKVSPQIYPEYSRLRTAQIDFAKARLELQEAEEAWEKLGN